MKNKTKRLLAFLCAVVLVATTFLGNWYTKQADVKAANDVTPVTLEGFKNVTVSDFEGLTAKEYKATDGDYDGGTIKGKDTFDDVLFSTYVKFNHDGSEQWNVRLDVGGKAEWSGLAVYATADGNLKIEDIYKSKQLFTIPKGTAGVDSFLNTEFLLQLSFEYVNATTIEIGVYINGEWQRQCKFTDCREDAFYNYLGICLCDTNRSGVITLGDVEFPVQPVQLEGFEKLTLKDFIDDSNNVMAEGVYDNPGPVAGAHNAFYVKNLENFDKKLLSMKVEYAAGSYQNAMMFSGNGGWGGFILTPNESGDKLEVIEVPAWADMTPSTTLPSISASDVGITSFFNTEFLLQMSFDYGEVKDNRADLKLGIYINGKLCNDVEYTITDVDMTKTGTYLSLYREVIGKNSFTLKNVVFPPKTIQLEGYENVTVEDFYVANTEDEMPSMIYSTSSGAPDLVVLKEGTTFHKKMLAFRVEFDTAADWGTRLDIGGVGGWQGITIRPHTNGTMLAVGTINNDYSTASSKDISNTAAAVSSFWDNEFLLQLTFDYGTVTDGKADVVIGIYIDGTYCGSHTVQNYQEASWGKYLRVYREGTSAINIKSVDFDPFYGYDEVSVEDFTDKNGAVMESKAYTDPTGESKYELFTLNDSTNFHKKLLSMKVKFKYGQYYTRFDIGGTGEWTGISLYTNGDGSELTLKDIYGTADGKSHPMSSSVAGVSSFLENQFLLQMTFDIGDFDGQADKEDIEIGVYINGALYNDETFIFYDCGSIGNYMGLYRQGEESVIIVGSVNEEGFPVDMGRQPSGKYEKITFGHFGIVNKKYAAVPGDLAVYGSASGRDNLDKTVISGDIRVDGSDSIEIIWGGANAWQGIRMYPKSNGTMQITWINLSNQGTPIATLNSDIAGVDFVGEKYSIMLSAELIDNDGDDTVENINDLKIGIWFNGILYNQEYIVANDLSDIDTLFGDYFAVYCPNEGDSVTFGSVMDLLEQPNADFKEISYVHFGIQDGRYDHAADWATSGKYNVGTLDKTVIKGNVLLSGSGMFQYVVGGKNDIWDGMRFMVSSADSMILKWYPDDILVKTFSAKTAGVNFEDEAFDLTMSIEVVDKDGDGGSDIKLGVWFNGFLYENDYIYIADKGTELGAGLGVYCEGADSYAILNNEPKFVPDKSFDKVTFSDFGYETGIYKQADATGSMYVKTATNYTKLDKVVFSGDFRLSDSGDYQIIYGGTSDWNGLRLIISSSGNAWLGWFHNFGQGDETQAYTGLSPIDVGLESFTKETFNLKISTELVDSDGDGNKTDIKLGIWFNDILYSINGNEYSILTDWGNCLGNYFSIYYGTAGTSASLRNDAGYQANPYYYEDISSYRQDSGYTYPEEEGYVFSGWYADADYTEFIGEDVTSGKAWAKFVQDDVLTVKPQIKVDDSLEIPSGSTSLRVATTVDDLLYRRVSFYIAKETGKDTNTYGSEFNTATVSDENARMVYEKLYYVGDTTKTATYKPSVFSWQSDYFKTFTIKDIPESDYSRNIKVTPYWITMDGTTVRGKELITCVSDYTKPVAASKVTLDFLGENTMPIAGYSGPYLVTDENDELLFADYNSDMYFKIFADAGINLITNYFTSYSSKPDYTKKMLELGSKYGVGIFVNDNGIIGKDIAYSDVATAQTTIADRIKNYSHYDAFAGLYLVDEPGTSSFLPTTTNGIVTDFQNQAVALNNLGELFYANMNPIVDTGGWSSGLEASDRTKYQQYIDDFNEVLNPAYLSYDYYPFQTGNMTDGEYDLNTYFYGLAIMRSKAQTANNGNEKPFWAYVQAGSQWNDKREEMTYDTAYFPSESQFNWNVNTTLAFGAKGIQYFPLIQPEQFSYSSGEGVDTVRSFEHNGLIGAWGNKTQWYYYAQEINKHIAAIDEVLMNATSTQIIAPASYIDEDFSTYSWFQYTPFDGVEESTSYNELTGVTGDAVIGCFDYNGKTALYVVNYETFDVGETATTADITLTFNGTYDITRIENAVTTETSASSMTLSMDAGEGILLVIE